MRTAILRLAALSLLHAFIHLLQSGGGGSLAFGLGRRDQELGHFCR